MTLYDKVLKAVQEKQLEHMENKLRDIETHFQCFGYKNPPYREILKFYMAEYDKLTRANYELYSRLKKLDPSLKVNPGFSSEYISISGGKTSAVSNHTNGSKMEARYEAMRNGTIKPAKRNGGVTVAEARRLRASGMSAADIADKFGDSLGTVYRRLKGIE